ncbi:MAG: DUF4493 domain-containing protein [Rikenellaceae bacterium]
MKRYILTTLILIVGLVGCQSVNEPSATNNQGTLQILGLSVDCQTRADINADSIAYYHVFEVTITDLANNEVVEHYDSNHDMPLTLVLDAGSYSVVASTAQIESQIPEDGKTVGFDIPQYLAEQEVEIVAGELTPITLVAYNSTAIVNVYFSDLFKQLYPCEDQGEDYSVEVSCSNEQSIVFAKDETRAANFEVTADDLTLSYQLFIARMTNDGVLEDVASEIIPVELEAEYLEMAHQYNLTIGL